MLGQPQIRGPESGMAQLLPLLRCPVCRATLAEAPAAVACPACSRTFEVIHGIPDLRPDPPEGGSRHGDFCLEVIRRWPDSSYRELWGLYHREEGDALQRLWDRHEAEAPERGERRWDEIARHAAAAGQCGTAEGGCATRAALDVGCGAGSALFGLAQRASLAVGLDILLTDLLLAKKRFAEAGIANVALVCASALEMPFADECFGLANATDVIEHVPDQGRLLGEVRRVLSPGGLFFFNSPNRFSLLTREPHVKLWGMGWLPRRWMEPYVRWRLGRPYRSKRLVSLRELRRLVREAFGPHHAIRAAVPGRRLARAIVRPFEALALPLLPQHNVVAWKSGEAKATGEGE
ncbi:MAG: class I SAM-dependent methyltransferase [Planctomycetes bacterium]|nr:class I SAM-dependent methyltransferase [Planctomycetota bacterium]